DLPIFSGRFAVELGAAGQNPLPEAVFDTGGEPLYLGVRVEGRALGALQKVVPTTRTHTAALAESARVADMVGDLTPEEIASRRSWATSGEVAPGATLELQTFGDATDAEVFLWERRGTTWVALDPDHDLADDPALVAWYPFEDVAGTQITDASGHARHLTTSGTVTFGQEGVRGSAVAFGASGGAADSSTFGHVMTPTSSLTIAMWLRPNKLNSDDYPFLLYRDTSTRDYQFHFYSLNGVCPNGRVSFDSVTGLVGDGTCTRHSAPPGVWTHIAATVDPDRDTAIVYVNGVASDLESGTAGVPTGTLNYLRLGNFAFGSPQTFFDGRMDELVILGRALSPEEVADLHRYGVGGAYPIARHTDGRVTVTNTSATPRTLRLLVVK
ncbi:MAG: hypothetical protein IT385_12710, partial [Deltaproteobacteria bacterium]|nr:hypothetical protein [Deltaproteobacteria bacterium]